MKKALIARLGDDSFHDPKKTTDRFAAVLEKNGFETHIHDDMKCFDDLSYILEHDLIVFSWTLGEPGEGSVYNISEAVKRGVGLAGCHGGLCDAFRYDCDWQYLTGGQWVAHPGGDHVKYTVNICDHGHIISQGVSDFEVCSEQYYLHVDPAVHVIATTDFDSDCAGKKVVMPAAWTRRWYDGRVFYLSVGHTDDDFAKSPDAEKLMERGMLWAAKAI